MVGHRRSPPQIWNLVGWRVVPTIPYVGNFATVSRELSTKPLTVFRAGEQAERTKAEHAPDKCVHVIPADVALLKTDANFGFATQAITFW
ncbi:MAG: hypothetical protein EOR00_10335 [Mesorhizobium sp.]|jgi:hypothetical protein|uniref:hypothetical protein n=1 Tax=Mesorhizobium sp. TaxID=1871066 RepID=UPI000FE7D2D4|nr:hypothetical protein [Mesorhizobium sp.]RWP18618.1 MAG: hypothetical protein EOR00_10335 [Mesorhizobium sp.]